MQTSLYYGASLNALTVPLQPPLPPAATALAQRLTAVQTLTAMQTLPLVLPPMVCRGIIPPATGKHIKTVTLGISGMPGRDLHHFRVDIVHQSYPSGDCIKHCLFQIKQRRLLMYTQIASARERANLLCLYANNDGGSHAMLSAKKNYPTQTHSTFRLDCALSFRGDITFFAVMYKNSDGLRQPLFTLTRTDDNTLVAYAPGQQAQRRRLPIG